ncbi:PaaI family thioesterase [Nevskia soli]|uniref:PaaI family thioesterase n=1 Tax=Nevskia soli TaxID=418856 RepID=UPI0004A73199|nr:PaaI family thioesterase [Nevskia soli]
MDLELAKKMLEGGIKFVANSGLRVVELRRGYVKCLMPFAGNGNHIGTMYAGALFTLAEIPGGALFLSSFDAAKFYPIVKELDLRFLKPAKGDVTVEIALDDIHIASLSAQAAEKGKAEFILEGQLKTADGVVVAESRGVYQVRSTVPPVKAS